MGGETLLIFEKELLQSYIIPLITFCQNLKPFPKEFFCTPDVKMAMMVKLLTFC